MTSRLPLTDLPDAALAEAAAPWPEVDPEALGASAELGRSAVALLGLLGRIPSPAGLTPARWRVLEVLAFQAPPSGLVARNLAGLLGVAMPTATRLVDPLVAEGLLTRTRPVSDRRVVRVSLTAAGRAEVEAAVPALGARARALVAALGGPAAARSLSATLRSALPAEEAPHAR